MSEQKVCAECGAGLGHAHYSDVPGVGHLCLGCHGAMFPPPPPSPLALRVSPCCKAEGCDNAGRYNSGYCGICDIKFNEGRGSLR